MGCTEIESVLNNPITNKIEVLRRELNKTPWYHFMERIYIKEELRQLEITAFQIGINIALNDLEEMGILTRV